MGRTAAHPGWYLTEDGAHLRSTVSCIADPALCLTKLISKSSCRVYGVSLPRLIDVLTPGGRTVTVIGASLQKPDFAVKVIPGDKEFDWERTVAEAVCSTYNSMYCDGTPHHVIGTHCLRSACSSRRTDLAAHTQAADDTQSLEVIHPREEGDARELVPAVVMNEPDGEEGDLSRAAECPTDACCASLDAVKAFLDGLQVRSECAQLERRFCASASPCRWRHACELSEGTGGTIAMRVGKRVGKLSFADSKLWQRGVFRTLRAMHQAGYFHCDIRPENVLLFGEEYQLVDYDRTIRQDRPTVLFQRGAQYDQRGASLLDCVVGERVLWSAALDYEMVTMATLLVLA
jgi:hypothetical protein